MEWGIENSRPWVAGNLSEAVIVRRRGRSSTHSAVGDYWVPAFAGTTCERAWFCYTVASNLGSEGDGGKAWTPLRVAVLVAGGLGTLFWLGVLVAWWRISAERRDGFELIGVAFYAQSGLREVMGEVFRPTLTFRKIF